MPLRKITAGKVIKLISFRTPQYAHYCSPGTQIGEVEFIYLVSPSIVDVLTVDVGGRLILLQSEREIMKSATIFFANVIQPTETIHLQPNTCMAIIIIFFHLNTESDQFVSSYSVYQWRGGGGGGGAYRGEYEDKGGCVVRGRARGVDHGKDVGGDPVEVRDSLRLTAKQIGARVGLALLKVLIKWGKKQSDEHDQ